MQNKVSKLIPSIGKVAQVEVKVLTENTSHHGSILAENGLSLLIETKSERGMITRILMDTGKTGVALLNNVKEMSLDLNRVDIVVISHNHHDHTSGLPKVLAKIERRIPIIMHPDVFKQPRYRIDSKSGRLRYIGPPFSVRTLKDAGAILTFSKTPIPISEGVIATGQIPRTTDFERVEGFYVVENGEFKEDQILDDQALVVRMVDDSLIILTGCGHSGIVNTTRYALKLTGARSVRAIIGGFHLIDAKDERIVRTVEKLKGIKPQIVAPMHCTGFKAKMRIAQYLPKAFRELYSGETIRISA
ncbi:MAG: MBL fold metallo-hydrolase [Candidatus Freyarchaeota archaeon]